MIAGSIARSHRGRVATLILALLVAFGTCYYFFALLLASSWRQDETRQMATRYAWGGDFYPVWLTGRALLAQHTDPYTPEATRNIQIGLYGRPLDRAGDPATTGRFLYPPYADFVAAPLLPLRFETARVVLSVLLVPLTAASVALWMCAFRVQVPRTTLAIFIILTLASYPVLEGLYALQAGLLVGVELALAVAAVAWNRLWVAGVLLAVASVKPQTVWLLAALLLLWTFSSWRERKRLVLGFFLTMALLCGASWIVLPGWMFGWWHAMVNYSGHTQPPLPQLLLGKILGWALSLGLIGFAGAIGWKCRRDPAGSASFSLCVSIVLALTALLLPTGGEVYDQVVLLPAVFWLWGRRGEISNGTLPLRVLALAALVAMFWQWVVACGVAAASFVWPEWARNAAVVVLPARMAASLPFVVMAMLGFFAVGFLRGRALAAE